MTDQPLEREATMEPTTVAGTPIPVPVTSALSTIIQWLVIFGVLVGLYFFGRTVINIPPVHLKSYQVIILSFCSAFTWVYIFKWGSVKPFNCVTCLSGWFALILGYWSNGLWGIAYMPIAMTVGALYSEIRMRWL